MTPFQQRLGHHAVQYLTGLNTVVYRLSGGRVAGHLSSGAPLMLLTTSGRKTGRERTVPLLYIEHDDRFVLVASRGGMSEHPAWYLNLQADPRAIAEIGRDRLEVSARPATAEEREIVWPQLVAVYPHFDAYQARTDRLIPVVVLERVDGHGDVTPMSSPN